MRYIVVFVALLVFVTLFGMPTIKAYNLCDVAQTLCDASKSGGLFWCTSPYAFSIYCNNGIVSWSPFSGECGSLWCLNSDLPHLRYQLDQCYCYPVYPY